MSRITTAGTFAAKDVPELMHTGVAKALIFSGSTLPSTLQVGILDELGTFVPITGGGVTALPTDFIVDTVPPEGLALYVDGGSPDFVIKASKAGPLSQ